MRSFVFRSLSCLLGGALVAQTPPPAPTVVAPGSPERLQALLQELAGLDAGAWAARVQALQGRIAAEEKRAAELKAQAATLLDKATQAEAAARAVQAELARLLELQKLLQAMPMTRVEPPPAAPAAPSPVPVPTSPPPVEPPKAAPATPPTPPVAAGEIVTWAHVEPLFAERCSACHEPSDAKGGLDVTTFAAMRRGGGSGRTLVAGEPDQSRLYLMVNQQERPFMPKGEDPLAKEQIARIRTWIEQGATDDEAAARAFLAKKEELAKAQAAAVAAASAPGPLPRDLPAVACTIPARPPAVRSLARSPNASLLAMPGIRQILWFDGELRPLGVLPVDAARVESLSFSADGTLLAAAIGEPGRSGAVAVFDVATGRLVATCGKERDVPLAVAVHAGSGLVALGGAGKRVRVFALADGAERFVGAHDDFVLGLAFSPDGLLLAAGDRTGAVHLWETDSGQIGESLAGSRAAVLALAFGAGQTVVTAEADGSVRGYDASTGRERWRQAAHTGEATAVALMLDGTVASAGADGRIRVFDRAGKPVQTSPSADEWLQAVAFGATAEQVFAGDCRGRVFAFDRKQPKQLRPAVPLAAPAQGP